MDFNVSNYAVISIGPIDVWITQTLVTSWAIMGVLIAFAIIVRLKLNNFQTVPSGFQNFIEWSVETFERFVANSAGEKLTWLGGWFFTVFLFLLTANLSGLIGLRPPTADWPLPFALALITFVIIQIVGIRYRGMKYIKSFFEPVFLFAPLNILGELARPISLSFRLFGNVLGGMILVSLVYAIAPVVVRFVLPWALHAYFDVVSGALQAFIFTILGLSYVGAVAATADEA